MNTRNIASQFASVLLPPFERYLIPISFSVHVPTIPAPVSALRIPATVVLFGASGQNINNIVSVGGSTLNVTNGIQLFYPAGLVSRYIGFRAAFPISTFEQPQGMAPLLNYFYLDMSGASILDSSARVLNLSDFWMVSTGNDQRLSVLYFVSRRS